MDNIFDLNTSFEDTKKEEKVVASENLEVQQEEQQATTESDCCNAEIVQTYINVSDNINELSENTDLQNDCETDEQADIVVQEEVQIEPEQNLPDKATDMSEIKDLLLNLSNQFESKLKYDMHKDAIIDKLHAENQSYKNDLLKKIVMPFVNEIIFLIDDYAKLYNNYSKMDISEIDTAKLLKQFGEITDDLEILLNKNGIESFSIEDETVDFTKQKVIKTVITDEPEKDKTICERLKKGFIMDEKIIRQEWVSCYKFEDEHINK